MCQHRTLKTWMNVVNSKTLFKIIAVFLIVSPNLVNADNQAQKIHPYQEKYQPMLDSLISHYIRGAVLLVESPQGRFLGSAGYKDLARQQAMTTDVVMPTGSAGKKLTALLVAMLADEGVLDLDAPITKYLQDDLLSQIPFSDTMTLRNLLNHTSGLVEYNDVGQYDFVKAQFALADKVTTDSLPLSFALNKPADFKPGEGHSYSNTGYTLAGVILERVLKAHPAQAIRSKILQPLNMTSSYCKGVEAHLPPIISGFFINEDDPTFPTPINTWVDTKKIIGTTATSDAPLASSVSDMATLLKAITTKNNVVNDDVRAQMIGEQHLVKSYGPRFYRMSDFSYGLGIWVETIQGKTIYHHGGTEFGYYTQNIYIPEGDISITAFANCGVNEQCEEAFQDFTFAVVDSVLSLTQVNP